MTQFEQTFNVMKKPLAIVVYAVLAILAYQFADQSIAIHFHNLDFRAHWHLLRLLTALGENYIYLFLFAFLGLFFRYIKVNHLHEMRSWYLLLCMIITNLTCLVVKIILGRARPELLFSIDAFGFYWFKFSKEYWSMPSGHTMTVISLAAGLGVVFPRLFYAFLALALLIVITRVLLYYHYLSDVMTGMYLSILIVGFITQYVKKKSWIQGI